MCLCVAKSLVPSFRSIPSDFCFFFFYLFHPVNLRCNLSFRFHASFLSRRQTSTVALTWQSQSIAADYDRIAQIEYPKIVLMTNFFSNYTFVFLRSKEVKKKIFRDLSRECCARVRKTSRREKKKDNYQRRSFSTRQICSPSPFLANNRSLPRSFYKSKKRQVYFSLSLFLSLSLSHAHMQALSLSPSLFHNYKDAYLLYEISPGANVLRHGHCNFLGFFQSSRRSPSSSLARSRPNASLTPCRNCLKKLATRRNEGREKNKGGLRKGNAQRERQRERT